MTIGQAAFLLLYTFKTTGIHVPRVYITVCVYAISLTNSVIGLGDKLLKWNERYVGRARSLADRCVQTCV